MIFDKIENAEKYYGLGKNFELGLKFLQENNLLAYKEGKFDIDGRNVYVSVQNVMTKELFDAKWEAHKKYTDIQFLINGVEKLGFTTIDRCTTLIEYDEKNDISFLDGTGNFLTLHAGEFVIFMPDDVHRPLVCDEKPSLIKKAVVKLK